MRYEPPTISSAIRLGGTLGIASNLNGASDAEIKHGVESVAYEAPEISDACDLSGSLIQISAIE